jgi:lysozyme family protein
MIADVLRREGGYVNHPADRGGPTNMGITLSTLERWRGRPVTVDELRALSPTVAAEIYREAYWRRPAFAALPTELQPFLFDCAVNHGPARAVLLLQRVLNLAGYGLLAEDGKCGPRTVDAAKLAQRQMGAWLLAALVEERRNFYFGIVASDESQRAFMKGWMARLSEFEVPEAELV